MANVEMTEAFRYEYQDKPVDKANPQTLTTIDLSIGSFSMTLSLPGHEPIPWLLLSFLLSFYSVDEQEYKLPNNYCAPIPQLVTDTLTSLESVEPSLCSEGVGGTYFVSDVTGAKIAVFKPTDEEPGSSLNPKGLVKKPLLPPGGGAIREVAAYLLDNSFAGVPETYMMDGSHPGFNGSHVKTGSVQRYVPNEGTSTSRGSNAFLIKDVHRIGILDIRIHNLDRNTDNMLIFRQGGDFRLIPIDHTYCLPESLGDAYFDWQYWHQASCPFSTDSLNYIENINIDEDAETLRHLGLSEASIHIMKISTIVLKKGAANGLTLAQIASIIARKVPSKPSPLEILLDQMEQSYENFDYEKFESLCIGSVSQL